MPRGQCTHIHLNYSAVNARIRVPNGPVIFPLPQHRITMPYVLLHQEIIDGEDAIGGQTRHQFGYQRCYFVKFLGASGNQFYFIASARIRRPHQQVAQRLCNIYG